MFISFLHRWPGQATIHMLDRDKNIALVEVCPMLGLDTETRDMVISTLQEYAERKLKPEYLRELDEKDQFPAQVLKDLYDPDQFGLHLMFIPEEYGGLGG